MAHSIQEYNKKTEVINDLDLVIVMGFALELMQRSTAFRSLQNLAAQWEESLHHYAPGTIDLKLGQHLQASGMMREFDELLNKVIEQISSFHDIIPADILNSQLSVHGIIFRDYNVSFLKEAVRKIQALIATN